MKSKKQLLMISLVFFVFGLSAIALPSNIAIAKSNQDTFNIAMVYSTGGLGDLSFNDAAKAGLDRAVETHGTALNIDFVEPETVTEINTFIEQFASSTDPVYDLVIAIGFSSAEGLTASAEDHPETNFVIIDSVVELPNVASIVFREEEGSFLVGAMAAMTTQSDTVAFLGGLDIPLINRFRAGFEQGALFVNPDIELLAQYAPDASNPWGDVAGGKAVANTFIDQGADVIFAAAGGTGEGVFQAAEDADADNKVVYGVGVDSDQDYIAPSYIMASMVKRVDVAVETQIDALVDETWDNGTQSLGIAEDGVGISEMKHTGFLKNSDCTSSETRYDVVLGFADDIKSGTIVVNGTRYGSDLADYDEGAHACTEAVPDPVRPSASAPGFELFVTAFGIFVVASLTTYKKRKN